ncbi:hypothetical protein NM688_g7790 [Phlebia brevispora]|uniref:Uncharacterized protein n=1 Tax=Phlebia brevispora TaxID=194682 RepID=A0ACC1S1M5_9APHY|nr:hypothetical protein NM688_g7790 [Phlebia brevispora]
MASTSHTDSSIQAMSVAQLSHLSQSSPLGHATVRAEMSTRHLRMLARFLSNVHDFMPILRSLGAVISGSFALNYVLGTSSCDESDLDIYVPFDQFQAMVAYLADVEGYMEDDGEAERRRVLGQEQERLHDEAMLQLAHHNPHYTFIPVETGILRVASLRKATRKIDVIQSKSASALYAITRFWSTLQMNYLSASGYCVAYPQTTFRRIGVVSPHVMRDNANPRSFVLQLIHKYEARGYTFRHNWFEDNERGCSRDHAHVFCPTVRRTFEDKWSYCGSYASSTAAPRFNAARDGFVTEWKVTWQLGGHHQRNDEKLSCTARAWHSVTGQGEKRSLYN